jgi:sulfane dehydrogenase subunit SoxC
MMGSAGAGVSLEELGLAARNHGMPLEALSDDVTPVGLHYLLTHYDIPHIDGSRWRLVVEGRGTRVELSLDELQAMPAVTRRVTMECAGNGRAFLDPRPLSQPWLLEAVGTGEWTGVALDDVLALAGLAADATELVFSGADRGFEQGVDQFYQRSLPVAATIDALLAYGLNGAPLPPQHGFPMRLIVTGWYGMTNVKWLTAITAVDQPFEGHQQKVSYRIRCHEGEPGEPLTRMLPRALMIPPGVPDFVSRARYVGAGPHVLTGRAWSGHAPVTDVAVSADGGTTWAQARVDAASGDGGAWQGWNCAWDAQPGDCELWCRATDAAGNTQPVEPRWNLGGYANNAVQRVRVHVN